MRVFWCALLMSLLMAGASEAQDTPPARSRPILAIFVPQNPAQRPSLHRVTRYAQTAWGSRWLSTYGCLTTVMASILKDAGYDTNPLRLRSELKRKGLYDGNGRMYGLRPGSFRRIDHVYTDIRFTGRAENRRAVMRELPRRLARGEYVALKISRYGGEHWVRAFAMDNGDIRVMDPAGGRIGYLSSLYGSTRVVREAVFFRKIAS